MTIKPAKSPATDIAITISGQELFYSKLKQTFESMVRKAQRDQLMAIHAMLVSTDMKLKPELENKKSQVAAKMATFRRMSTMMGNLKQHSKFE